jgi:hypothetical protein
VTTVVSHPRCERRFAPTGVKRARQSSTFDAHGFPTFHANGESFPD